MSLLSDFLPLRLQLAPVSSEEEELQLALAISASEATARADSAGDCSSSSSSASDELVYELEDTMDALESMRATFEELAANVEDAGLLEPRARKSRKVSSFRGKINADAAAELVAELDESCAQGRATVGRLYSSSDGVAEAHVVGAKVATARQASRIEKSPQVFADGAKLPSRAASLFRERKDLHAIHKRALHRSHNRARIKSTAQPLEMAPEPVAEFSRTTGRHASYEIMYHGTSANNLASIAARGLLPGGSPGVPIRNGAVYGRGVYVSPEFNFARGYGTVLVVAVPRGCYRTMTSSIAVARPSTVLPLYALAPSPPVEPGFFDVAMVPRNVEPYSPAHSLATHTFYVARRREERESGRRNRCDGSWTSAPFESDFESGL